MPLVSVVIPTRHRPGPVCRAVRSVMAQSYAWLEVIVVVDGPDLATIGALAALAGPRLRVVQNAHSLGAGPARNAGAAVAHGPWLAFLDDDDEWLPDKLALQLAGRSPAEDVVLSCRCRVHTPGGVHHWPRRLPGEHERLDDYLFARRSLLRGEAYLATPTLVLPAWLFRAAGGFGDTPQNEDTTLQLRATGALGARLVMLPEPLVVVHATDVAGSLGSNFSWRASLDWLDAMGEAIGRRAYSGFCLVTLGSQAARRGDRAAIPVLLRRAWRRGRPSAVQLALFASFWLTPVRLRHCIRRLAGRRPDAARC